MPAAGCSTARELSLTAAGGLLGADVVFPALHGPYGEDGTVQGLLECLDVPYVGSGVASAALCMDKVRFKALMGAAGLPQVDHRAVARCALAHRARGDPRRAGAARLAACSSSPRAWDRRSGSARSARPASWRSRWTAALAHDSLAIVEAASSGLEVECSLLGDQLPRVSPPGEIVVHSEFYDYAAKYDEGGMTLVVPARIGEQSAAELARIASEAFVRRRLQRPCARRLLRRGRPASC